MRTNRRPDTLAALAGRSIVVMLAVAVLAALAACGPAATETEEGAGPPVTNSELGITMTRVPEGFRVARNEGASLVLEHTDPEAPATLAILVGPVQTAGINLPDQVWEEKARIEALPSGEYKGQNELAGAAIGTVYTSRGRYLGEDGEPIEEYRALAVHPRENRLLILDYEYPPTERTGERLQELMAVLETIDAGGEPQP